MIIILNGAPNSGKDTTGDFLEAAGLKRYSFKKPMFDIAKAVLPEDSYDFFMRDYNNREQKERHQDYLGGLSIRQFMIHISEHWVKPLFGCSHFGKLAADNICEFDTVVTDGGFPAEVVPLLNKGHKVVIVRLHRKNCTFSGDSRTMLTSDDFINLPFTKQPTFLDVEVVEGYPYEAGETILRKIYERI